MKTLRVCAYRVAELPYMTAQEEVEGFDLVAVLLSVVEACKRSHNGGTANTHASNSRQMFEAQVLRRQSH